MRIRKNASKLLGSAIVYSSAPFPPPSDTWDPPSCANPTIFTSSGELCELNQSPWDVYPNLHFFTSSFKDIESPPCLKEAQQVPDAISGNDKGILGKSPEKDIIESETKPLRICKRYTTLPTPLSFSRLPLLLSLTCHLPQKRVDVKLNREKKNTPKKKKKMKKQQQQQKKTTVILCKKHDGKKWFCKRPAQLPHSFCEYHLNQSRSYYSTHKEKEVPELESWCTSSKKKENGGTMTNPYYYYNGFWPSSRIRRGARNAENGDDAMHVDNVKKVDDVCDAAVAGSEAKEDCAMDDQKVVISGSDGEEKSVKKRRRKPTKCRSLKSLL
ncbi:hypothetical protein FCM35_KLT13299 [Carex littledalei]|uniref:WRC domain-containing protein n=1 Tax=Carex littledalei TaxID=544730 RepID=A0A833QEM0_9POAL|nr:hypothetical protein FCM35_KLT13299 [Carex littledalei]